MTTLREALSAMLTEFGENFPPGVSVAVDMAREALETTVRCCNCRHWYGSDSIQWGNCYRPGLWRDATNGADHLPAPDGVAVASTTSVAKVIVHTGPDFGCAHWERRVGAHIT